MEASNTQMNHGFDQILDQIEKVGEDLAKTQGYSLPIPRAFVPSAKRFNYTDPNAQARLELYLESLEAGSDFYFDVPSGFLVMTALKHIKRGFCCNSGCRHCPYIER